MAKGTSIMDVRLHGGMGSKFSLSRDKHTNSTIYQYCLNDEVESVRSYCTTAVCLPGWSGKHCDQKDVETPESDPVTSCGENNGGCGEDVCVEVGDDVFDVQVKCNPPDEEIFKVPTVKPMSDWNYKGCFNKMHSSTEETIRSVESCSELCDETFYGIKNGELCTCANIVDNEVGADRCNKKCSDGLSCGGESFYSVYASKVSDIFLNRQFKLAKKASKSIVVGCFKYLELEHKQNEKDKAHCLDSCKELGFPYSGTGNETCQCGRDIEFKDQLNKEQCKEPSVFFLLSDVSPDLDVRGKPTKYNYCMNDRIESKKAYCQTGLCKLGWTGALCDKRDCNTSDGACGEGMICVQEIVNYVTIAKCLCRDGLASVGEFECKGLSVYAVRRKSRRGKKFLFPILSSNFLRRSSPYGKISLKNLLYRKETEPQPELMQSPG
ncbi:hypothetical protein HELRODRAFT_177704 [Helobdella robusta]|uniref:WSC domain-containing protein n=1 Tax=Helobdella robusta TaxID=6412 RepID=T1FC40_HELRO|nr:hypothetical protein HELRODRAFT_177704 [Helobdella robusta]ESN97649.1 hypothetical protein HELRODRAFT_177704 [Helobdella robusta]